MTTFATFILCLGASLLLFGALGLTMRYVNGFVAGCIWQWRQLRRLYGAGDIW